MGSRGMLDIMLHQNKWGHVVGYGALQTFFAYSNNIRGNNKNNNNNNNNNNNINTNKIVQCAKVSNKNNNK